ncbi:hypothetical protein GJR96_15735 [Haloferax sp. MBLA0076]|uniref:Amidase domain-containing protein n=1 Tax=Haloferax litoreum TaxID=2666140 RepID=A0A6A8GJN3_9EURY|nr:MULTISPECIES: amidase family protein [Haloferax]KAB1190429.1 hypothetical protein Hfx1148_15665 [Haloferax sp. CBA1148]MRX23403.1 hypothetical protein [Haloferax litoreum]
MPQDEPYLGHFLESEHARTIGSQLRRVSRDDVRTLGDAYDVSVDDDELDEIRDAINAMVDGLGVITGLPLTSVDDLGERSWSEPADNPFNAIATRCDVPPADTSGELSGLSIGVKDNVPVAGVPMHSGSDVLFGYIPPRDAPVVSRLRESGARIVAKTTMDEFAGGGGGTRNPQGAVQNPHDPSRAAGGSSSGSAVAVAASLVDAALGTDTGGSVRIPASFCGVVGFLPSYGVVPRTGVVEQTYTQDVVGPIANSTHDAARIYDAIAGPHDGDSSSLAAAGEDGYGAGGGRKAVENAPDLSELRFGRVSGGFGDGVDGAVASQVSASLDRLEDAGATIEEVSVPWVFEYDYEVKSIISYAELATHWRNGGAAFGRDGHVDERYQASFSRNRRAASGSLGRFFKTKLLAGAFLTDAYDGRLYTRARIARERIAESVRAAASSVDALVMPTMPGVAPKLEDATDPGYDYARNTRPATLARTPAITIPTEPVDGLPVGVQFIGERFDDAALLGIAAAAESVVTPRE